MTTGPDDAQVAHELDLVARAAKGDSGAFDRFFERHAGAVQTLVERLLGPGPAADEVVVEAFQKTVRRLPLLGARNSSPRLYVLTTARNGAYASLGRDRPASADPAVGALLSLPSRQRELLALRELGLSEADCAEVAGIAPAEVGVQIARARLRLSDALDGGSLSGVFADPRAERLLAAEVVRQEGASLPPEVDEEITTVADADSRFAAALSAVRSPSRSVGQLPATSGSSRLGEVARSVAVAAGGAASTGAASAAAAPTPKLTPTPKPTPTPTSDPYDEEIGDEAAWGIVDDFDVEEPEPTAPAEPARPTDDGPPPADAQWKADPKAPEPEPAPAPVKPEPVADTPLAAKPAADAPAAGAPGDLGDDFDGWDEVDWEDDDRNWTAGGADPVAGAPIAADPGETRPFDVVGAGLADADLKSTAFAGPPAPFDLGDGDGDEPRERRSPWRFLLWVLGLLLLFGATAFGVYMLERKSDDSVAPTTKIERTTPKSTTPKSTTPKRTTPKSTTPKATTPKSSSSTSKSTTSGSTTKSTGSTTKTGTSTTKPSTGSTGGTAKSPTVSSGGATSGGSVRGGGTASTTP